MSGQMSTCLLDMDKHTRASAAQSASLADIKAKLEAAGAEVELA